MTNWLMEVEKTISQAEIDRFARISGDVNSFHIDSTIAACGPFGKTVAHGVLLTTIIRGLIDQSFPGSRVTRESARFHAPTFPGEAMLFRIASGEQTEARTTARFEIAHKEDGTITCSGICEFSR